MTGRKADAVVAVLMNQKLNKIILKSNLHVKRGLKFYLNSENHVLWAWSEFNGFAS